MRLTTNTKLVDQRQKLARYFTFAGLAILLGSFAITLFNEQYLLFAYISLFVGFILAYVGATLANKWVKEPRADHAIEKALKGFDNKHHLYNWAFPTSHFLLTPTGILVFKIKSQDGQIYCRNGKWNRPWKWTRIFGGMGEETVGNPIVELKAEIESTRKWLADKMENAALVPIDGYVVFTNPLAQLTIDDPNLPVVRADDLKDILRKSKRGAALPPQVQADLAKALNEEKDAETTE